MKETIIDDNKFVFTNPGLLRLPVEQIYAGEETRARNQRIQNMFRMIGFGENLGSGFPLILSAWNEKHWLKPELIEQRELMQVKLILSIETKNGPKNNPKNDPKSGLTELTERQYDILLVIKDNVSITRKQLAQRLGISDSTIKRELAVLKNKGYLNHDGGKTYGKWIVLKEI